MTLKFLDANVLYGMPDRKSYLRPVSTVEQVEQEMARCGVSGGLLRRVEQLTAGAVTGNRLLARDVRNAQHLWGVWSILPVHTHEIPDPDRMPLEMKRNHIACWQLSPAAHRFAFHYRVLKEWLELARQIHVPIYADMSQGISMNGLLDILERAPDLTVIVSIESVWPCDRMIRPLLSEFPHTYFELSNYYADQGIEQMVAQLGADRLLFGSRFYECHFAQVQLVIKHARISEADRALIAGGNLERILRRVQL